MFKRIWSDKQETFLIAKGRRINLLSGSVRSGKTWISLVKFAIEVGDSPPSYEFLMTGKTITALKRNCLGLMQTMLKGEFSYSLSQKQGVLFGHKIYLEGANDERAESKIRGMTLGGAYADELTLIPKDFYAMLLSRLSLPGAKRYATTNPDNPSHYVKKDIIDNDKIDRVNWRFVIDDNIFLDPEYVKQIKNEYSGVFYDRFILGNWTIAEGLIYRLFADDNKRYVINNTAEWCEANGQRISRVSFGVDFGGSKSATAFCAVAITFRGTVIVVDEEYIPSELDPDTLNARFAEFVNRVASAYGNGETRADSAEQILIRGLDHTAQKMRLQTKVKNALKLKITERIRLTNLLMAQDRLKVCANCVKTTEAFNGAVWDSKKTNEDERLDDGTSNIDSLDAFEYAVEPYFRELEIAGHNNRAGESISTKLPTF